MDIQRIEQSFAYYEKNASKSDKARYDFFEGLYRLIYSRSQQVDTCVDVGSCVKLKEWYSDNAPVFEHLPVVIEESAFLQTLSCVSAYVEKNAGLSADATAALATYSWEALCDTQDFGLAGSHPAAFIESCLQDADTLGIATDTLLGVFSVIIQFALRAHLQNTAQAIARGVDANADRHTRQSPLNCPVCGCTPSCSLVGQASASKANIRIQYCPVCGVRWPFERIRCATCGSNDQTHLHYVHIDGDPAHRLQSCDECGSYQRVVFQEDLECMPCMEVEDVVMARLDYVAQSMRTRQRA